MIHGGPWLRDYWAPAEPNSGYAGSQLLANRGYAVLHINYRGSSGYGGQHMYAGVRELAGRTQDDITDGVQWAISNGIADPAHIGLLGDSFGGFSVLSQMTRLPERYACGVNIVGIADWERWLDAKPPYWRNTMHWWSLFLGVASPPSAEDRQRPVEYLLFADEGHAIRKWRNRLRMWRAIEDFYAACLGGRSSGFDAYQLVP